MVSVEPLRVSREPLGQKVADLLRRRILTGDLRTGTRLVEDELAAQLGTSRGPLRDAFSVLAREGLLSTTPGKGTYVKGLSAEGLRQMYDVRGLLEAHAAREAARRVGHDDAEALKSLVRQMAGAAERGDQNEYVQLDIALHRLIWSLSGNDHLVTALEYLTAPSVSLIMLNAESRGRWPAVVDFHRMVVDAIGSNRAGDAGRIMMDLLQDSLELALSIVSRPSRTRNGAGKPPRGKDRQR